MRLVSLLIICLSFFWPCGSRLLFTEVWESSFLPWPLSHTLSCRLGHVHLQLSQAASSPHQPSKAQHWRPQAAALLSASGACGLVHSSLHTRAHPLQQSVSPRAHALLYFESWYVTPHLFCCFCLFVDHLLLFLGWVEGEN